MGALSMARAVEVEELDLLKALEVSGAAAAASR
jgi:hypothetical protein